MKNPNIKFIFGIVLILCGWIICFDLFLLMIGLAFFLLGTILVLTAKKKLWVKILVIGLPILLWFIGFEIILHEISKPTSVTILIPENYNGEFRIVEGEKNGAVPTEENGRTILCIPENGNLITSAHLNLHENSNFEFYYINKENQRTKIKEWKHGMKRERAMPSVLFSGLLSPSIPSGQSSNVPRTLDYLYDSFNVNNGKMMYCGTDDTGEFEKRRYIQDQITDSLVKIERGIK
jgi:energy-coupling factor transporter transmembrane protein EcfT